MAKPIKLNHLTVTFFTLFAICQSSLARPLNGFASNNLAAEAEPALSLIVAGDSTVGASSANPSEKNSGSLDQHVLPCEMDSYSNFNTESQASKKLRGKYGPLVLNMLPKGTVPPSGPSKKINDMNN